MGRTVKKTKDLHKGAPSKPLGLTPRAEAEWDRLVCELAASVGISGTTRHGF